MPLHDRPSRFIRAPIPGPALIAIALASHFAPTARAQAPVPVTLDPSSTIQYRVTLTSHVGSFAAGPMNATLELGAPASAGAGPVAFRRLHFSAPAVQCPVAVQGASPVMVSLTQFVVDAAPGAGASLPTSPGPTGEIQFAGSPIACSATGAANYAAVGLSCAALTGGGAPCSGPFDLAAAGPNSSGLVDMGAINPGTPRTFSLRFYASFPLAAGATWGRVDVLATLRGTLSQTNTCPADFNNTSGLTVQDIFDFLAAWFAANPAADFNHANGLTVQDIFDFLAAWFTGC